MITGSDSCETVLCSTRRGQE